MLRWFRSWRERRRERLRAEEQEFFDAWDEMGRPDYDSLGNPIQPVWDEAAGQWAYPYRESVPPEDSP